MSGNRSVILYRGKDFENEELKAAQDAGFVCLNSRVQIRPGDLVIARYSALPYYEELARDVKNIGAALINSYDQHRYVADMKDWYLDLGENFTFKTWFKLEDVPDSDFPVILKGETNSRKFFWSEQMFADNRPKAVEIYRSLMNDGLIGEQRIYVRKYEPLVTYLDGFHGLPITQEYRFFCLNGQVLSGGFYWSSHADEIKDKFGSVPNVAEVPKQWLDFVLRRVQFQVPAFVVDVARALNGAWRVVELNDLQMSGLSENSPELLYKNLYRVLRGENAVFWETLGTNA